MKRVFIIHGWGGDSKGHWLPWLKTELEKKGYQVAVPDMPNTEVPVIAEWVGCLARLVGTPDEETYFVGGSIGCQTILRYLETIDQKVGGAVFVAGWFNLENLETEGEDAVEIAKPWIETPIDLEKVKQVCPKSTLIISDNDCYGAFEENKAKFAELGSKIVVIPGAGHFTEEDGCTKLPQILDEF